MSTRLHNTKHYLYNVWRNMRTRCLNKNNEKYPVYGGRGITICPKWDDFKTFVKDVGERPSSNYSLDRIDGSKGYYKENCRWATDKEQQEPTRKVVRSTNKLGISGVFYRKEHCAFIASARINGKLTQLYRGPDFFEACCVRKSWEAKNCKVM